MNTQATNDKPVPAAPLVELSPTPEQARSDAFLAALLRERRHARNEVARDFAATVRALAA